MFCPECGQANADAARFCTACGRLLPGIQAPGEDPTMATPPSESAGPVPPVSPVAPEIEFMATSSLFAGPPAQADVILPPPVFHAPQSRMPQTLPITPVVASTPCRVCGVTLPAYRSECPRCGTPAGMIVNASDPTANSYVPIDRPAAPVILPGNAGQRAPLPAELQSGWNWGAAFMTYLWAIAHRVWWYVTLQTGLSVSLIAILAATQPGDQTMNLVSGIFTIIYFVVCIVFRIYFGLRGNQLAWRYRRFDSLNQCLDVQETWKPAGIVGALIALLVGSIVGVLLVIGIIGGVIASMTK